MLLSVNRPFNQFVLNHLCQQRKKNMAAQSIIEVQQGIWIDAEWLKQAGFGARYQVVVEPGVIRILPLADSTTTEILQKSAWEIFRRMGTEAQQGTLPNTAALHDKYLYGYETPSTADELA